MSKALAPLTYRQQALLVGYLAFGESYSYIASELGRSVLAVELAYQNILAAFEEANLATSPIIRASPLPEPPKPNTPKKWQQRKFRVLASVARQSPDLPVDVTAQVMGDPETAAFERSLKRPPAYRKEPRYSKRKF